MDADTSGTFNYQSSKKGGTFDSPCQENRFKSPEQVWRRFELLLDIINKTDKDFVFFFDNAEELNRNLSTHNLEKQFRLLQNTFLGWFNLKF